MKNLIVGVFVCVMAGQMANAEEPVKKTFAELMKESIAEDLAREEAERLAIEAAKPTEDSIAADCDAKGDLAVNILMMSKDGVAEADAKVAIRAEPEAMGSVTPEGADMMVQMVYAYMSKSSPESVKERIVKNCLIK